jgi:esterase/lipase
MKNIICSHGFGVKADSRGMFTDVQTAFPNYTFTMFDYNQILDNDDVVVAPIDAQAQILQHVINAQNDNDELILLCHSQGAINAGLVNLNKISKVILLAPPVKMSMERVIIKFTSRPDAEFYPNGTSKLPRSDGTYTYISKDYIESLEKRSPIDLYQQIANQKPTIIIRATNDNTLGLTNVNTIKNAIHIDIDSDHDFTGDARAKLIESLKKII